MSTDDWPTEITAGEEAVARAALIHAGWLR